MSRIHNTASNNKRKFVNSIQKSSNHQQRQPNPCVGRVLVLHGEASPPADSAQRRYSPLRIPQAQHSHPSPARSLPVFNILSRILIKTNPDPDFWGIRSRNQTFE
jgi:hypothetical protein